MHVHLCFTPTHEQTHWSIHTRTSGNLYTREKVSLLYHLSFGMSKFPYIAFSILNALLGQFTHIGEFKIQELSCLCKLFLYEKKKYYLIFQSTILLANI